MGAMVGVSEDVRIKSPKKDGERSTTVIGQLTTTADD